MVLVIMVALTMWVAITLEEQANAGFVIAQLN
jgi:hypothetical protein